MAKVSMAELYDLQNALVRALKERVEQDLEDNLPTDAATLGVIVKLLKDNSVTADPADADDLSELRERLKAQSEARKGRAGAVLQLVQNDLKAKEA